VLVYDYMHQGSLDKVLHGKHWDEIHHIFYP
jgi:hypothetical protein